MRKYYACFTDLSFSTHAERLFHIEQISWSPVQSTATPPKTEPAKPKVVRPAPVRIITKPDELVGKPFRELGEVSGESCQATNQDSPPNISTARKRMQINAAKMKANAVLLHSCEVTSGTPGCYRQAVCIGSALNITAK